jgi:hypothetical protein
MVSSWCASGAGQESNKCFHGLPGVTALVAYAQQAIALHHTQARNAAEAADVAPSTVL